LGKLEEVCREFIAVNNIPNYEERKVELKKFFTLTGFTKFLKGYTLESEGTKKLCSGTIWRQMKGKIIHIQK